MKMRRQFDSIAVGVGTILADNPRLTIRGLKVEKQPIRIIFDPNSRSPKNAKILQDKGKSIFISKQEFPSFNLKKILKKLFDQGIHSIFLEGGMTTAKKFLEQNLIDEIFIFQKDNLTKTKIWQKKQFKKIDEFDQDGLFYWQK
jgi:riboflavin biosynthesis pyrimidine reductase